MHTHSFAKTLLVVVFSMTCAAAVTADPIVCNPKVMLAPPESATGIAGFFGRLITGSEKPQPFSGVVMDDPDPGCSLASDARSVAAEPRRRERDYALD